MRKRPSVYLAAPLFNDRERSFNAKIAEHLSIYADVFLPQKDGLLLADLVKSGIGIVSAQKMVFEADIAAMAASDVIVAILDGATVDDGVAFEIGYMFACGKICVGLQTDVRRQLPTGNNPMLQCSLSHIFDTVDGVADYIRKMALQMSYSHDDNYGF